MDSKLKLKIIDILKRGYSDDANFADLDNEVADRLIRLISQLLSERTEPLKEIKKTLDGESIYEKNGMSKLEIIDWIVETELSKGEV
jgi:ribosomal protein S8